MTPVIQRRPLLRYDALPFLNSCTAMSKLRITGAMLRPRTTAPRAAEAPAADLQPVEPQQDHAQEAVASHPLFVAPQFGYRRSPGAPGGREARPPRPPRSAR
ncbi:hypothetical protein AAG565_05905 [Fontimonas sp. SYSU GA230001]|uniref:hypothetical protein n=1 Tax=Fontimonas sp. SYSU GA230001 TaxID=3142450 RepID=UPI0032B5E0C3